MAPGGRFPLPVNPPWVPPFPHYQHPIPGNYIDPNHQAWMPYHQPHYVPGAPNPRPMDGESGSDQENNRAAEDGRIVNFVPSGVPQPPANLQPIPQQQGQAVFYHSFYLPQGFVPPPYAQYSQGDDQQHQPTPPPGPQQQLGYPGIQAQNGPQEASRVKGTDEGRESPVVDRNEGERVLPPPPVRQSNFHPSFFGYPGPGPYYRGGPPPLMPQNHYGYYQSGYYPNYVHPQHMIYPDLSMHQQQQQPMVMEGGARVIKEERVANGNKPGEEINGDTINYDSQENPSYVEFIPFEDTDKSGNDVENLTAKMNGFAVTNGEGISKEDEEVEKIVGNGEMEAMAKERPKEQEVANKNKNASMVVAKIDEVGKKPVIEVEIAEKGIVVGTTAAEAPVENKVEDKMEIKAGVKEAEMEVKEEAKVKVKAEGKVEVKGEAKMEVTTNLEAVRAEPVAEPNATAAAPPVVYQKTWAGLFKTGPAEVVAKTLVSSNPLPEVPFPTPAKKTPEKLPPSGDKAKASTTCVPLGAFIASASSHHRKHSDDVAAVRLKIGEFLKNYSLDLQCVNFEPRGLLNFGNNCYMNATLQALVACPPFYNLFKSLAYNLSYGGGRRGKVLRKLGMPVIDSLVQFVDQFQLFSHKMRRDRLVRRDSAGIQHLTVGGSFEPKNVYNVMSSLAGGNAFVLGQQHDAQEFLTCLLNGLNDEMAELIQGTESHKSKAAGGTRRGRHNSGNKQVANGELSRATSTEWLEVQSKNKFAAIHRQDLFRTPISDIFRGQMRSRLHKTGDLATNNIEPFLMLHLNIVNSHTLLDALLHAMAKDEVKGVTSTKTKQVIEAWQQQTMEEPPTILIVHLKYFVYKDNACSKILKNIEYPMDLRLDSSMTQWSNKKGASASTSGGGTVYKLFSVVYHDGTESSKGHYLCDIFHMGYEGWLRMDDSRVSAIEEKEVLNPKLPRVPYLLCYRR